MLCTSRLTERRGAPIYVPYKSATPATAAAVGARYRAQLKNTWYMIPSQAPSAIVACECCREIQICHQEELDLELLQIPMDRSRVVLRGDSAAAVVVRVVVPETFFKRLIEHWNIAQPGCHLL